MKGWNHGITDVVTYITGSNLQGVDAHGGPTKP